jgi:hypothetical protein
MGLTVRGETVSAAQHTHTAVLVRMARVNARR